MVDLTALSNDELRALRDGHLRTVDDILTNDVFLTVPTARLIISAIRRIENILFIRGVDVRV